MQQPGGADLRPGQCVQARQHPDLRRALGQLHAAVRAVYTSGGRRFNNWAHANLGMVDARKAIAFSCNPWYYDSAVRATPGVYSRQLKSRLTELGYSRPTGLEIVGEKTGLLTDIDDYSTRRRAVVRRVRPEHEHRPGRRARHARPGGAVMSTIINEGQQRPLTVVKAVDGKAPPRPQPVSVVRDGNTEIFRFIKEGMHWTTSIPGGTASTKLGPNLFPVPTAGKTGTAENGMSARPARGTPTPMRGTRATARSATRPLRWSRSSRTAARATARA